jgi:hypothetical protein
MQRLGLTRLGDDGIVASKKYGYSDISGNLIVTRRIATTDANKHQSGTGSTRVTDATRLIDGYSTVKVTTGVGLNAEEGYQIMPDSIQSNGAVCLDIYIEDWDNTRSISIYLSEDNTYANFALSVIGMNNAPVIHSGNGWHKLYVDAFDSHGQSWSYTGTFDFATTTITTCKIRITPESGFSVSANVGKLSYDGKSKTQLMLSLDDGYDSQPLAASIANPLGIKLTHGIISSKIDTPSYMTLTQVHQLKNDGNAIVNHSEDNTQYFDGGVTLANYTPKIIACSDFLNSNGLSEHSNFYIYPGGEFHHELIDWLKDNNFTGARGTDDDYNRTWGGMNDTIYRLHSFSMSEATPLADIITKIRNAVESGSHISIFGHQITETTFKEADFRLLCGVIADYERRGALVTRTLPQFLENAGLK